MRTVRGHVYVLGLRSAVPGDPSWMAAPLTATYPVTVISIAPVAPGKAVAEVQWTGAPMDVTIDERAGAVIPGAEGSGADIYVDSIEGRGPRAIESAWPPAWKFAAAVGLVAATIWMVSRIPRAT